MNLNCQAYSYIFFRVSPEFQISAEVSPDALSCFEKWMNAHDLKPYSPPDLQMPDVTMLRLAAAGELSVCIIRFHDLDIVEIGRQNTDDPLELWEKSLDEFQKQIGQTGFSPVTHLLSAPSLPVSAQKLKDKAHSEISGVGRLYRIQHDAYLLHSQGEKTRNFITRDFPLMVSSVHKIEFEEGELRKLEKQNHEAEKQIEELIKKGLQAFETHFEDIRQHQIRLRQTVLRRTGLRQTLHINIGNLRSIGTPYLSSENDLIFTPRIERFRKLYRQMRYDLNYARLKAEEIESQINLFELQISQKRLKIEQRREEGEKRFARWIGLIGVPLGIGGATTNMPNEFLYWMIRLGLMGIGGAVIYALYQWQEIKAGKRDI